MGIIGGELGYRVLKRIAPGGAGADTGGTVYLNRSKLEILLGTEIWDQVRDRSVIDFGCGTGDEVIELAQRGARHVVGLDLQDRFLSIGRAKAQAAGIADRCTFATATDIKADIILSLDAFEHFDDPAEILQSMRSLLGPRGRVLISFGPTWFHPLGGHLFSVFPWAHLIFTEKALIRWRSDFKTDGATRFAEVAGGLNQMTIRRFERIVASSPFYFERFEAVPIRRLRAMANRITREWTSAIVRCTLAPKL